eukprot:TRINITY_DN1473_c0_g3_i1.p1 TRINITY_DN1473_c0_g3~~TRINITY_DN1473_c0_g3_i1.p1  ORF type:complete len:188 (-),score=2.58 TRINITY_DN1473_c0_g3_i1:7-570(-)
MRPGGGGLWVCKVAQARRNKQGGLTTTCDLHHQNPPAKKCPANTPRVTACRAAPVQSQNTAAAVFFKQTNKTSEAPFRPLVCQANQQIATIALHIEAKHNTPPPTPFPGNHTPNTSTPKHLSRASKTAPVTALLVFFAPEQNISEETDGITREPAGDGGGEREGTGHKSGAFPTPTPSEGLTNPTGN